MSDLSSSKVLVISTNKGVEQDELTVPIQQLRQSGAEVTVAAAERGEIHTVTGGSEGRTVQAEAPLREVDEDSFDLLLVPGGTVNSDHLRLDKEAQRIVKQFAASGRIVAAICHAPWLLVETGHARGKRMTSYRSLRTDLTNAGASWTDEACVVDASGGWTLITSRSPRDLPEFIDAIRHALRV